MGYQLVSVNVGDYFKRWVRIFKIILKSIPKGQDLFADYSSQISSKFKTFHVLSIYGFVENTLWVAGAEVSIGKDEFRNFKYIGGYRYKRLVGILYTDLESRGRYFSAVQVGLGGKLNLPASRRFNIDFTTYVPFYRHQKDQVKFFPLNNIIGVSLLYKL